MKTAAFFARIGNKLLSIVAALLILTMLLYGAYSLWDTAMIYRGAFASSDLLQYKPSSEDPGNPTLAELRQLNPDVRGWITIDATHIDYPVVQGKNNMEYVNKDVYGDFSLSGAIFLDSQNQADFSDPYNLLYGHHIANGGMFGDIVEFVDADYFSTHLTGNLYLEGGGTYAIQVFACVEADAYDGMIYQATSWKEKDISPLLDYIRETAIQYQEIGVTAEDKIVGLSTCAEAETNGRVVVFGRLMEEKQVEEGDTETNHD